MDGPVKLYSPEQVREMFPEGRRPALKRLIAKAKEAGCCCKLGRGIGLTEENVKALFEYITVPGLKAPIRRTSYQDVLRQLKAPRKGGRKKPAKS